MAALRWLGLFLLLLEYTWCQNVTLTIPLGTLTGRKLITPKGTQFYSFEKIPFAEPPVGDLRFQPPVPKKNSTTVYDNTNGNVVCYQSVSPIPVDYKGFENEDCLYLSIYTPQLPRNSTPVPTPSSLPVLVYFSGGGFLAGGFVKAFYGPDFMIDDNIIVALVNYRIGPFGFLSTNDTVVPGNYGLKDQLLALQWIHRNIGYFGGNPFKITIGGESAGGASVMYMLMAEKARGLFRGAIAESASALTPWAYQSNARSIAFQLARVINPFFLSNNSTALRNFLRGVSAEKLKQASITLSNTVSMPVQAFRGIVYSPVIEVEHPEALITHKQYAAFDQGNVTRVPLFIGYSSEEAIFLGADLFTLNLISIALDLNSDWLIPYHLQLKPGVNRAAVANEIKKIYVGTGLFLGHPGATIRFLTDNFFTRSVIKTAELMSKWVKVYFYQLSYSGKMGGPIIVVPDADRVGHTGEHNYIWRVNLTTYNNTDLSQFPPEDVQTHYRLVNMWTNFVKNLNPSIPEANWPDIRAEGDSKFLYMNINTTLTVENQPKPNTYPKWNAIYLRDGVQPFTVF